ncbi:hypothetical protein ACOSP7_028440 [Xanthoceras sorbifolium]
MAIKLNMSKAYDRVGWPFLLGVMAKLGFSSSWIQKIDRCVSSVTYLYLINGSATGFLKPSRGLRHLYLFLLCVEGLSGLLKDAESSNFIHSIRCGRRGP